MIYLKRIGTALIFILGLLLLLAASSLLFIPKNNMAEFGMDDVSANGILGERDHSIDVLVIGDSEASSSVIPMQIWKETGYTTYVSSSPGQSMEHSDTLLRQAFKKQSPKIVILETDAIYRGVALENIFSDEIAKYLSIFKYHNRWKSLSVNDLNATVRYTWTNDNKGYIYNTHVNPSTNTRYMKATENLAPIDNLSLWYVKRIKAFCDENNAKLIFLSTPSTVNWNTERHNGIQALTKELGCEYIDLNMNAQIGINWNRDTHDKGDHLNYSGATKVTDFLSKRLAQETNLTDHRKDSDYTHWNEALKRFETSIKGK